MTENQQLFNALVYQGGGIFRDSRIPKGETAPILHGEQVLELARQIQLDVYRAGGLAAAEMTVKHTADNHTVECSVYAAPYSAILTHFNDPKLEIPE